MIRAYLGDYSSSVAAGIWNRHRRDFTILHDYEEYAL